MTERLSKSRSHRVCSEQLVDARKRLLPEFSKTSLVGNFGPQIWLPDGHFGQFRAIGPLELLRPGLQICNPCIFAVELSGCYVVLGHLRVHLVIPMVVMEDLEILGILQHWYWLLKFGLSVSLIGRCKYLNCLLVAGLYKNQIHLE